jgi:ribosomal protein S8
MSNHLDKFISMVNQSVNSGKGPFFIIVEGDISILRVLALLQSAGFLHYHYLDNIGEVGYSSSSKHNFSSVKLFKVYFSLLQNGRPIISRIIRISKSSKRVYFNSKKLRSVYSGRYGGFYTAINTSQGLM